MIRPVVTVVRDVVPEYTAKGVRVDLGMPGVHGIPVALLTLTPADAEDLAKRLMDAARRVRPT